MQILTRPLSQLEPAELSQLLLESGALLLRSGAGLEDFLTFSKRCAAQWGPLLEKGQGPNQQKSVGGNSGREMVDGRSDLFTTTGRYQGHPVPLHGELYFQQHQPPQLLWFYCQLPPLSQGETWFCDGGLFWRALSPETREFLQAQTLVYMRVHPAKVWQQQYATQDPELVSAQLQQQGFRYCWQQDTLTTYFEAPVVIERAHQQIFINNLLPFALRQIQTPEQTASRVFFAEQQLPEPELILRLEQQALALTQAVGWQKGDVVLIDNTRILHGRGPVNDSQREIYVRMAEADFIAKLLGSRVNAQTAASTHSV